MRKFLGAVREQTFLFRETIADHLGHKHEVYGFAKLLDEIDMNAFKIRYSNEGGKAYDPRIMLSILVYGFHRSWHSSRELQRACMENDAMRYLVGGLQVKFRAIADFRVKFDEEISQAFSQSVSVLKKRKQTVGVDIKVDGTKIKANAADDQTYTKEELVMRHEKLENEIREYLRRGIELDKEEDSLYGKDNAGDEIDESELNRAIEEIKKARKKRQREEAAKAPEPLLKDDSKPENVDPDQQSIFATVAKYEKISAVLEETKDLAADAKINITDPDARFMKRNGKISQSYNAEVASSEGYIVAADIATGNAENDLEQLPPILNQAKINLGSNPEKVTTDAGYFHSTALAYLEKEKIEGFIPSPDQVNKERKNQNDTGYESHYFEYDSKEDEYICPEGHRLEFQRETIRDDKKFITYQAKPVQCVRCPVRENCCSTKNDMRKGFRQLEVDEFADLKHAMINKMKTKEAIAVYKKRGSEIEPIFGILKQGRRFREFLCRGKQMARMHLKIASIALNFGKMVREGIA